MKNQINEEVQALKKAKKVLKFWFKVLLETPYMNDCDHRKEYRNALDSIALVCKKKKGV